MPRCLKITLRDFTSELSFSRKKETQEKKFSSSTTKGEIFYLTALRLINKVAERKGGDIEEFRSS